MFKSLLKKLLGSKTGREVKRLQPIVTRIREVEEGYKKLSDAELKAKTAEFRERLAGGAALDDLLPEAFAAVSAACRRLCGTSWKAAGNTVTWDMVPFDVQLMGGIVLHEGKIAEMATGEGKTLVAVAPLYLNALPGKGAHLVTVNDYLAQRDAEWMGPVFEFLGMTVGKILTDMEPEARRASYNSDITYGTNNEFGFDYLRDNMSLHTSQLVQRGYHYGIVDEVDSVLIDEARTPLIIAGQVDNDMQEYVRMKPMVERLHKAQTLLANKLVTEGEELRAQLADLPKGDGRSDVEFRAGLKLLQVQKGQPKNTRLMKLLQDVDAKKLLEKAERFVMLEKKMRDVEADLYFVIDEKGHTIDLTDLGREFVSPKDPEMFVLKDIVDEFAKVESDASLSEADKEKQKQQIRLDHERKQEELHSISQLLRAYTLYIKDVDYLVDETNQVVIVDEHTGRPMRGRRWSDGLHQAVEAKEGVKVERETQTLATITLQNFFRMYAKLAGMTGTAETEAQEFLHTYTMDVVVVPTNRPIIRADQDDVIYKTKREKYAAILDEIEHLHKEGLPVLVGTRSVEVSELLSKMLQRRKISHNVLNAKQHAREADIVRDAGQPGQVTIATNMAGRGTDIKLGSGVVRKGEDGRTDGGLQILGTERHDSRRIDRQLRGRAGRQGDPGATQFFLSLEDDLMRLFITDRMSGFMSRLGLQEGEPIVHPWVTRAIESAQKKVENRNFEIRKRTLEYDNVMNKQRTAIYGMRREVLVTEDLDTLRGILIDMCLSAIEGVFVDFGDPNAAPVEWNLKGLLHYCQRHCPYAEFGGVSVSGNIETSYDELFEKLAERLEEGFDKKLATLNDEIMMALAKRTVLATIDRDWRDHLAAIDDLRENVWTAGYAQKEPLVEYQREASVMFEDLMTNIQKEVFQHFFLTQVYVQPTPTTLRLNFQKESAEEMSRHLAAQREAAAQRAEAGGGEGGGGGAAVAAPPKVTTFRREQPKVGRNEPCPCGSGKKYKNCCGR